MEERAGSWERRKKEGLRPENRDRERENRYREGGTRDGEGREERRRNGQ